jgi:hypothetical protein
MKEWVVEARDKKSGEVKSKFYARTRDCAICQQEINDRFGYDTKIYHRIRVIVIPIIGMPFIITINDDLSMYQAIVKGNIEKVLLDPVVFPKGNIMIFNDMHLYAVINALIKKHIPIDPLIFGPVVICRLGYNGELQSVTQKDMREWEKLLGYYHIDDTSISWDDDDD